MTVSNVSFTNTLGTPRSPLRVNPAVVVGLGDFGGVALRRLADRLRPTHPALLDEMGWLRLTVSGWAEKPLGGEATLEKWRDTVPTPFAIVPGPLAQAFDRATSQATVGALREAGYEVSATLDTVVVAHGEEPLAREALWPLLDLVRAQPPLRKNRVTLLLACDSRRFSGPSALGLAQFFERLAERLVADRARPVPGAIAWCYLCDTLDIDSRLLGAGDKDVVQSQLELLEGFLTLLVGSGLRRDPAYVRTALPELAHDVHAPPDAALVSSFSLGACVLPVDQIAALARDRLALRLHEAAFPAQASIADRDAAWSARERWLAAVDLSPTGLRDRLLRGPDDAPLRFDTTPPDLTGMDEETILKGLARWRNDLETRWAEEGTSPPAQIKRNADALLDELSGQMRREVDRLLKDSSRGLHQALGFLDELPQAIREAQIQLTADDSGSLKTVPSADQKFLELGELVTDMRWNWREKLFSMGLYFAAFAILYFLRGEARFAWAVLLLGLGMGIITSVRIVRRRSKEWPRRQADFISAVRLKFKSAQERDMRDKRRGILDELSQAVRQERRALQDWRETVTRAQTALADADTPPFQSVCGERPLCDPVEYPSPVEGYGEAKVAEIATHYLDAAARPYRREDEAQVIVAWLRQGAERALAGWRETLSVAHWTGAEPSQVIAELVSTVRPQWPLAPHERRQVELNVVGLVERDERVLPEQDDGDQTVVVSTCDPVRLSYVPTRHGLNLKELAATRPLWEAQQAPPSLEGARDTIHKTFVWRYAPEGEPKEHRINLTLSRSRYQVLRGEPRPPCGEWGRFVTAPAPELDALADTLGEMHRQRDWSPLQQASDVLAFTQQCITYDSDLRSAPSGEWPRYPLETLVDGVGDCEDAVILAAAVLKRLDYDVALLYYPGHCALGVAGAEDLPGVFVQDPRTGVKYFYGETTAEGWSLGQVPEEYREMGPEGIEVVRG